MINYASDEAQGSCAEGRIRYHSRTNTQGLKNLITEKKVLPL